MLSSNVAGDVGPQISRAAADEAISQPDQIVADVDRRPHPVPAMQCFAAVAIQVIVLDVVVDERSFVEGLDRHRHAAPRSGNGRPRSASSVARSFRAGDRIVGGQRDERPRNRLPPLASQS